MKLAVVVGHNVASQGARRVTDGQSEYIWCGLLAQRMATLAPRSVRVFRRTPGSGEIARVYREVADWGAGAAVELHFNSFSQASATGTETLHNGSATPRALALAVQAQMVAALGLPDRGLKKVNKGQRGFATVSAAAQPTVLLEPYFGSNAGDCNRADARIDALARAILVGCGVSLSTAPVTRPAPPAPEMHAAPASAAGWLGALIPALLRLFGKGTR